MIFSTPVPALVARLHARLVADVLVVGLLFRDRMMGEFEMRHQFAVAKERGTRAGAERQHEFDAACPSIAASPCISASLIMRTGSPPRRFAEHVGDRRVVPPLVAEMRRRQHGGCCARRRESRSTCASPAAS